MFPFNFHTLRETVVVIFKTLKPAKTFGASGYRGITVAKYGWNLKRSSSNFSVRVNIQNITLRCVI